MMKSKDNKIFIIAEAGVNHNGDLKLAKKMIDLVKEIGIDCIKFQTFKAGDFIVSKDLTYTYKSQGKEITESQYEMFKRLEFAETDWQEIIAYCQKQGVVFSTTPQNFSDLEMILKMTDLPFIKIGSDDLTNLDLLKQYALKQKPMIISAGMAAEEEIADAIATIRSAGNNDITVLHCVSSYPAEADEINLKKIQTIRDKFSVKTGFSDHAIGSSAAIGAVCFGAEVIEKHFTLDHNLPGPDHWFSADPKELKQYVSDIRFIEQAIGSPELGPTKNELTVRKIARRSLVAKKEIKKGEEFSQDNLDAKRPGSGISPRFKEDLLGKKAARDYQVGELIQEKI